MTQKKDDKRRKFRLNGAELDGLGRGATANNAAAVEELKAMRDRLAQINTAKAAMSVEKRAGFIFEEFHAGTFNAAARKAGDTLTTAHTGASGGFANDTRVDILVTRGKETLAEVQAKCYGSAGRSVGAAAKQQYAGTDLLLPADQAGPVKEALSRSVAKKATSANPVARAKGVARGEAAKKVTDRVRAEGHSSKPLGHGEAQKMASGDLGSVDRLVATEQVGSAFKGGAISGAAVGGTVSVLANAYAAAKGSKSTKEAAVDIVKDTAASTARGAGNALLTEGVKVAGKHCFGKEASKVFLKGSAPAAIAGCTIDMVEDAIKGELTVKKAAKNIGRAGSAYAGAEGGAILGGLAGGPLGALLGGILGGLAGSLGFGAMFG